MSPTPFAVIDDGRLRNVEAVVTDDGVRLPPAALHDALGWELRPEGLCQGTRCIAVRDWVGLVTADGVDLVGLAALLERPLALDVAGRAACLGAAAEDRGARLASLEAPDFTLADLAGRPHALSEYRGTKVLLLAWASW